MSNKQGKASSRRLPLVSVAMATYNHEKYVVQAIEGVLAQKTSFSYELIVHDDASTDCTQEIIKQYQRRFPDIIISILQIENQYSKGIDPFDHYIIPLCKGKYIAFCEGDDYWIDTSKLEKQVRYLEVHTNCAAIYHNCDIVDENGKGLSNYKGPYKRRNETDFTSIRLGLTGEYPGQTASALVRKSVFEVSNQESLYLERMHVNGDRKILMRSASKGYIHVLPDVMSCHRVVYSGGDSWTARTHGKNLSGLILRSNLEIKEYLKKFSPSTKYPNQFQIFHAGLAVLIKAICYPTAENRRVLQSAFYYFRNKHHFFITILINGVVGIPMKILSSIYYR